jgi:hypothetical protein
MLDRRAERQDRHTETDGDQGAGGKSLAGVQPIEVAVVGAVQHRERRSAVVPAGRHGQSQIVEGPGDPVAARPQRQFGVPLRFGRFGVVRVAGRHREFEDLVRAQHTEAEVLGLEGRRDGAEMLRLDRGAGDRAQIRVTQGDGPGQAGGVRADRSCAVDVQAGQVGRVGVVGPAGHRHPPPPRGEGQAGMVQSGTTADGGEPPARIGEPGHPVVIGEQVQHPVADPPTPRLRVVGRGRPAGRHHRPVEGLVRDAMAERAHRAGRSRRHRAGRFGPGEAADPE